MTNDFTFPLAGVLLLSLGAQAATFTAPARRANLPSLCAEDTLISVDAATQRSNWAFRCGLLETAVWQPVFAAVPGRYSYPVLAHANRNQVFKPDYGSCLVPASVTFYEVCENGQLLFDGATKKYGAGQTWDTNGSTAIAIDQGAKIRFELDNKDYWGAAAYVFDKDFAAVDLRAFSKLHLQIRNSGYGASLNIQVFLVDMNGHEDSVRLPARVDRSYQDIVLNLDQLKLNGFPLEKTQAMVIAISEEATQHYALDVARISVD